MSSFASAIPISIPYESLFFVAGEASGDLLGSLLIKQLKMKAPHYVLNGVGGSKMVQAGLTSLPLFDHLQVMGISDVLLNFPAIATAFLTIEREILKTNPAAVILIDYQTFNLKLAKSLRKKGYQGKIIQYVSPTVWAWKAHRIPEMAKNLDLLLTLFPFEPNCYEGSSLKSVFVGHPLLEVLPKPAKKKEDILVIFPGSRLGAIRKTFPIQLKAAKKFLQLHPNYRLAISCASMDFKPFLHAQTCNLTKPPIFFSKDEQYEWMDRSRIAFATCGTVTMELAWFSTPTIVFYGLSLLNGLMAKFLFNLDRIPYYCMVNILEKKEVFPEKIKAGYDPDSVLNAANMLLGEQLKEIEQSCHSFWNQLRPENLALPSEKAAIEILGILT